MYNQIKSVNIVYFSGTGNTRKVAGCFESNFEEKGISVQSYPVADATIKPLPEADLLLVLYAVIALNAPEAVYRWIESLPVVNGKPAVVISVSGGGEVSPNTACRVHCIRKLTRKGYTVQYDAMLVMPSNFLVANREALAVKLLEILPDKVERIIVDILSGVSRKVKPGFIDQLLSRLCEIEKIGAKYFGTRIKCSLDCTGCGWCSRHCPAGNIRMDGSKPVFQNHCNFCLSCLYGCPRQALRPGIMKFILIKEGYSLKALEQKTPWPEPVNIEELAKGYLWAGVRQYLLNEKRNI